jgi:hypothetical protein
MSWQDKWVTAEAAANGQSNNQKDNARSGNRKSDEEHPSRPAMPPGGLLSPDFANWYIGK